MKNGKEVKIAVTAIIALVVLYFGMNFLKGTPLFTNKNIYYVTFTDINGLSASNPIFANGYQVGVVRGINFDYNNTGTIVVAFSVDKNLRLPVGTKAEIESDFMGNVKLNLIFPEDNAQLTNPGDTIQGQLSGGLFAKAAEMLPTIQQIIPKLDSIVDNVNLLTSDPSIRNSLHNADKISSDLIVSTKQLNTLLNSLNKQIPELADKANSTLDNANQLSEEIANIDFAATMEKLDQTVTQLKEVSQKLSQKDGNVGLLLNDTQLYDNLNTTLQRAEDLLDDFKQHPKRYINFSVFGKK